MWYRWRFSCGHQSVEALWLEFREITFDHYNLSISSEMAAHLLNKCCFAKIVIILCIYTCCDSYRHTFFRKDYSPGYPFFMNRKEKKKKKEPILIFFKLTSPISYFSPRKIVTIRMYLHTRYRILHTSGVLTPHMHSAVIVLVFSFSKI